MAGEEVGDVEGYTLSRLNEGVSVTCTGGQPVEEPDGGGGGGGDLIGHCATVLQCKPYYCLDGPNAGEGEDVLWSGPQWQGECGPWARRDLSSLLDTLARNGVECEFAGAAFVPTSWCKEGSEGSGECTGETFCTPEHRAEGGKCRRAQYIRRGVAWGCGPATPWEELQVGQDGP